MNLMESLMAQRLAGRSSGGGSDLTPEVKEALLDCFANVAWATEDGQQYYDALADALYGLQSISAVYTQSGTVYDTDSLDSLKADLVVTALYGDGSTQTVPAESYTLSGTLTEGTSTITVSYGGKTATFDVTVAVNPYVSICSVPASFVMSNNPAGSSWNSSTLTGSINGNGTSAYPGAILQGLKYKWPQVSSGIIKVEFDYTLSGKTGGGGALVTLGGYTSANPANNSTARPVTKDFRAIKENGSGHYSATLDLSTVSWSGADNYYVGLGILLNTNTGANVTFSNVSVGVAV